MFDFLSETALSYINSKKQCPLCKKGYLIGGPHGGSSQNFRCNECGQEFNLGLNSFHGPVVWIAQTLGKDDSRANLYTGELLSEHPYWKKDGN